MSHTRAKTFLGPHSCGVSGFHSCPCGLQTIWFLKVTGPLVRCLTRCRASELASPSHWAASTTLDSKTLTQQNWQTNVHDNTWPEALDKQLQSLARSGNFIANRTDPGAESQNWPTPRWLGSLVRIVVLWNDMETWTRMSFFSCAWSVWGWTHLSNVVLTWYVGAGLVSGACLF